MPAPPLLSILPPLRVGGARVPRIEWPWLHDGEVLCVAVAIDWTGVEPLQAWAARHVLAAELSAAQRYLHREDRLRHLAGRALLRQLAAHYGGSDADQPMPLNPWGKPAPSACTAACNVSHTGDYVLAAVGRSGALGIDVERTQAPPDARALATGLHPTEQLALARLGHAGHAFMRCWTRKEAIAKATGMGLSLPLDTFAVDCGGTPHDWLVVAPPDTAPEHWHTLDLPLHPRYVSALAIHGRARHVKLALLDVV